MKYLLIPFAIVFFYISNGCVQKAYQKTAVINLTVQGIKDIKTVGIRGNGNPLSWDQDVALQPVIKDSLYTITVTTVTGYRFAEIKFTVNGEFELQNQPNRRLELNDKDTIYYNAVFNLNK